MQEFMSHLVSTRNYQNTFSQVNKQYNAQHGSFCVFESFSTSEIIRNATLSRATCNRWIKQRDQYGSPAYRKRCRESKILGRKLWHPPEFWKAFVSRSNNNGEREQELEVQMAGEGVQVGKRRARYHITKHTEGARIYATAHTAKKISRKNRDDRVSYGNEHKGKPIDGWWNTIYFTDEAHYDPLQQRRPGILRDVGTRYDAENIVQPPPLTGVKLLRSIGSKNRNWYSTMTKSFKYFHLHFIIYHGASASPVLAIYLRESSSRNPALPVAFQRSTCLSIGNFTYLSFPILQI
ncbi:hypothetical protein BJ878DRAFT_111485 [Calycina marina]|uniref:Uncharacterized protein n=1 Tax=Calycina marina TaxID=1763456 RepID=A0A9P7Z9Q4_9HELO|nr:hypothetical protein BJ878DRAFT_111485 [Calycina marina]